jgi:alanyl-tRNA synthetase
VEGLRPRSQALTERLYHHDAYLLEFDARVVERTLHQDRPAVVLDRTAFYPESGGQPWDTGSLGSSRVEAVLESSGEVLHVLDSPVTADRVHGVVDASRRRRHRQEHHGQHLLSRAFVEVASARTVGFHLGAESSSIDLDREVGDAALQAAETRANHVVWEGRPVTVRTLPRADAQRLGIAVPGEAGDDVRLVEAEGFDLQPCGGTHPRSTAEVGVVIVLRSERHKGGTRVGFVCGDRALEAVRLRTRTLDRVGALLSAPLEDIQPALLRTLEQLAAGHRQVKALKADLLAVEAAVLADTAGGDPPLVSRAFEGRSPEDLRALATAITTRRRCLALLGSRGDRAHLVFAQTPGLGCDVPGLLAAALPCVGGRGGGRGDLAQGGGEDVAGLEAALASARAAASSPKKS